MTTAWLRPNDGNRGRPWLALFALSLPWFASAACSSEPLTGTPRTKPPARAVAATNAPELVRAPVSLVENQPRPRAAVRSPQLLPQVIVKFKTDGPSAVTECPSRWLSEHRSFATATSDRSTSLDAVMKLSGVRQAHALMPGRVGLSTAQAEKLALSRFSATKALYPLRAARPSSQLSSRSGRRGDLTNVYTLDLPPDASAEAAAAAFARDPHVEYAEVNGRARFTAVPNDPYYATTGSWGQSFDDLWNLKRIGAAQAWDTTQGQGVLVAVVDSGLDLTHPDIAANVWSNPGEIPFNLIDDDGNGFVDDVHGYDFVAMTGDPTDDFGHGTHVAGTIAAVGNNGQGVIGVAPRATLMVLKALDASGNGAFDALA